MINSILGMKINQTQNFTAEGKRIPVTQIEAGPCPVIQVKTPKTDGYWAIQLGFGAKKESKVKKPIKGHLAKAGGKVTPRFLREIRVNQPEISENLKAGQQIKVGDVFKMGDMVNISGISKGKGFAGVVKRWHFKGGPRTHGQSDRERAPGSIGSTTTPGRVLKGKKMAGHLGKDRATVRNLEVVLVDPEKNLLEIKGLVPGKGSNLLLIRKAKDGITS